MNGSSTAAGQTPIPVKCRITCASRLHLGLLNIAEPFGGVGLMVSLPRTVIEAELAPNSFESVVEGPGAERIGEIIARVQARIPVSQRVPIRVCVHERPLPHSGLGTGTQLALAASEAIAICYGLDLPETELAVEIAQRGKRSAVGIHGYFNGGFLVERIPHQVTPSINPMERRWELPTNWRVALFRPVEQQPEVCGQRESHLFAKLPEPSTAARAKLEAVLEQTLIPSADRGDFEGLSEAIYQYNQLSGSFFASIQGGSYNGQAIEQFVRHLRRQGVRGVGQSSWGPTVFAFSESESSISQQIAELPPGWECYAVATPQNTGRSVELIPIHQKE